jgi:serine/threonine protein kinase
MDTPQNLPNQKRERMKTCPQCTTGYPDSQTACPTHGLLLNEIRELKPGMVIHKTYRIVRKLGQGGMGTVYLAQHVHMDEPRALKFLSPELSRDQVFTARFLREVRTLRQIRNRNVVDCGDLEAAEDDSLFFSMEFVDGPDLRGLMHNNTGPLPVPLALSIARQIAEGLGAAHAKGMVHRDIKPENILMTLNGNLWIPKIADFGIVATKESSTAYTRTGGTLLTMAYAAPEQWRGTPAAELDGRTDLYALGGLIYEMLTGQTPFQAENYEGWARQHQTIPAQPPSALRPDLANWSGLDALTLRLLAKDRGHRPANVAELLVLIDAIAFVVPKTRKVAVQYKTIPAKTMPEATVPMDFGRQHTVDIRQTVDRKTLPGRKRKLIWIASVVVILICLVVFWRVEQERLSADSGTEIPYSVLLDKVRQGMVQDATFEGHEVRWHSKSYPRDRFYTTLPDNHEELEKALTDTQVPFTYKKPSNLFEALFVGRSSAPVSPQQTQPPSARQNSPAKVAQQAEALYKQKNYAQARPLLDQACNAGVGTACNSLAEIYRYGQDVPLDLSHAIKLYAKGCDTPGADACVTLGEAYENGWDVKENDALALQLYTNACHAGSVHGCFRLGCMYDAGFHVTRDYSRAYSLYITACNRGYAEACRNLGFLYLEGNGVEKDTAKARQFMNKSCAMGITASCEEVKHSPWTD